MITQFQLIIIIIIIIIIIWGYADSTIAREGKQSYIKGTYDELEIVVVHVELTIKEKETKLIIQRSWGRHNETLNFGELQIWTPISIYICGKLCDKQQ